MAITQYNTPAEQPIMDTYTPIPFKEMAMAGAMTQQRYEQSLSNEMLAEDQLSQLQGAKALEIPGVDNQYIKLPDYQKVEEFKTNVLSELDNLSSTIGDKSSPEYRSKQRAILTKMKRAMSPTGEIGLAMSNLDKIKSWNKVRSENPQLADDPSLYLPFLQKAKSLSNYASSGQVTPIDLEGTVGEYVNVNKELGDILGDMKPEALSALGIQGTGIEGVYSALSSEGVTSKRVKESVLGLIEGDDRLRNTFIRRAQWQKETTGDDRSVDEIMKEDISNTMDSMANIYKRSKVSDKVIKDEYGIDRAKQRDKDLAESFTFDAIDFKKGTQIPDVKTLESAKINSDLAIENIKVGLHKYAELNDLPIDEDGNITSYITSDGRDVSSNIKTKFLDPIEDAKLEKQQLLDFEQNAKNQAEFDDSDYINDPEWNKYIERGKGVFANRERRGELGVLGIFTDEQTPEQIENARQAFVKDYALKALADKDPAYHRYLDLLEEGAKDGSFSAGVLTLPETETNVLSEWYSDNFGDLNTSIGDVVDIKTGKSFDSDMFEEVDSSKAKFVGVSMDSNGVAQFRYALKDEEGKPVANVKVKAPESLIKKLISSGKIDNSTYFMNRLVSGKLGAFGEINTSQTLSANSFLPRELQNKKAPNISFKTKGVRGSAGVEMDLLMDGQKTTIGAANKLEAINKATGYFQKYNDRLLKNLKK